MNKLFAVAFSITAYTVIDAFYSGNLVALVAALILSALALANIKEPPRC